VLIGNLSTLNSFPTPPPTGTVHWSPLLASQFAVMMGALEQVPAVRQVVVDERLDQQLAKILVAPSSEGPLLVGERANHLGALYC
jgi:hypothetical protein